MTKRSAETMIAICDALASGMSYSGAAQSCGIGVRTFWEWIKASQAGNPDYVIEYLGEPIAFHKACNAARRILMHNLRSSFERRALLGHDTIITFQGAICWRVDPRTVGWSEDEREAFGFERDGLLRNERGETIPLTEHHEPPVAAVLRVLEVGFPNEYRPTSNVNSNVSISGSTTVGIAIAKPMAGPVPVPPPPPLPQLEVLPETDALTVPETDDEPADAVTDTAPEEFTPDEPEPVQIDRVIREPAPAQYAPLPMPAPLAPTNAERSGRPLTDLERDLLSRARGSAEARSAPITIAAKLDRAR